MKDIQSYRSKAHRVKWSLINPEPQFLRNTINIYVSLFFTSKTHKDAKKLSNSWFNGGTATPE